MEPPKKDAPQKNFSPQKNSPQKNSQPTSTLATAPYNFVALPEKVLPAPIADENEKLFSGEISLRIETLTPLFIGGQGSKTFAPVNTPIIPGSTLRGMFKNIFKIVTCGAFRGRTETQHKGEDFNDEHIYFRCMMGVKRFPWTRDLNKLYNGRMVHEERGRDRKLRPVKNARPGFLIHMTDGKYFIAPSIYASDRKADRISIKEYEQKFRVKIPERNSSCVKWDGSVAYIITGSQSGRLYTEEEFKKLPRDEVLKVGKQFIRYTKLSYVDWSRDHWFELFEDVRASYEHDRNRQGVDLLKDPGILKRDALEQFTGKTLSGIDSLIPCHFLVEGGQVTAFGHGQCFRIPYRNRIGDAVKISGNDARDFSDTVFGTQDLASRVCFEDAAPENFSTLPEATTHPLMQPNPTSYQFYLTQNGNDPLNNWDTNGAQLRGYKLYWHNRNVDWQANANELELDRSKSSEKRLTKEMTPLKAGNVFTSKIRFKNLSAIELGALMMIFDLDGLKTAAYKIGQGKPFGFGSVKITPKLSVEDETAYTALFDGDAWKNPCREENPDAYLAAFRNYVEEKNFLETWREVLRALKIILDWSRTEQKSWSARVKSMSGDVSQRDGVDERFKQRVPLPSIFEVVK